MAISKISSSSIDPNVSLGDGFFKIDSTNNRVGIGTSSPASSLSFPIGTTPVISQVATGGAAHSADNVGSLGLAISDGGGYSGVFVHNTHDGTFSSQDIRFLTAKGGNSVATERMRIDSSGRVTMPNQPSFMAYRAATGNETYNAGDVVVFPNTLYNTGGHYNTSNGRFTAPVAGLYHFSAYIYNTTSGYARWTFRINGNYALAGQGGISQVSDQVTLSASFKLTAGDYVYLSSNYANQVLFHDIAHTAISGYLIG